MGHEPVLVNATSKTTRCTLCAKNEDCHTMRYRRGDCAECSIGCLVRICLSTSKTSYQCLASGHQCRPAPIKARIPMRDEIASKLKDGMKPIAILHQFVENGLGDVTTIEKIRNVARNLRKKREEDEQDVVAWITQHQDRDSSYVYGSATTGRVGDGSSGSPFIVSVASRKGMDCLKEYVSRQDSYLMLNIDATFKFTHMGYPVVVIGFTDANRKFFPVSMTFSSSQTEACYTRVCLCLVNILPHLWT